MPIQLPAGYHKSGVVWVGGVPVVTCFDIGSYRNVISLSLLDTLPHETVLARTPCEPVSCEGLTSGGSTKYSEVPVLNMLRVDMPATMSSLSAMRVPT